MSCNRPITIKNLSRPDRPFLRRSSPDYAYDTITVPCGKCMACLKRKQSDYAVRLSAEAVKRGSMVFVTLTYNDDNLPLTSTLFHVDMDSGELYALSKPEFVACGSKEDYMFLRSKFKEVKAGRTPRYLDFDIPEFSFFEENSRYFYRVTPSVCREDVRLWLKRSRMRYLREFSESLPDFSYVLVPEYGPCTCRPHYHLAFFGLSQNIVEWMCKQWNKGYYDIKNVKRVNPDGSDGFAAASAYVGKYMSKGVFECDSVKDCLAEKPRICSSKGIGDSLVSRVKPYVLCYDLFGSYNPDTLLLDSGKKLSRLQIEQLIQEIPKRLSFSTDGRRYYALPRLIRNKIFYKKDTYVNYCKTTESASLTPMCRPTTLWSMVASAIRSQYEDLHTREFREFLSSNAQRPIAETVAYYSYLSECSAQTAEDIERENFKQFYSKSIPRFEGTIN